MLDKMKWYYTILIFSVALIVVFLWSHLLLGLNIVSNFQHEMSATSNATSSIQPSVVPSSRRIKILFWTRYYSSRVWKGAGEGKFYCENCEWTYNRSEASESDGLVFHVWRMAEGLPAHHPPQQRWILYSQEPPPHTRGAGFNSTRYSDTFNWTITYRRDSDITDPYLTYQRIQRPRTTRSAIRSMAGAKTKHILAIISQCRVSKRRLQVVKELRNLTKDLDFYGACSDSGERLTCNRKKDRNCMSKIIDQYRFLLAFENSVNCPDYITEKYWRNAIENGVVPVVLGPRLQDYQAGAIPGSYIHVSEFTSLEELAKYLKYLATNVTAYAEYFMWRLEYGTSGAGATWCKLCEKLRDTSLPAKTYNMWEWWEVEGCEHY